MCFLGHWSGSLRNVFGSVCLTFHLRTLYRDAVNSSLCFIKVVMLAYSVPVLWILYFPLIAAT